MENKKKYSRRELEAYRKIQSENGKKGGLKTLETKGIAHFSRAGKNKGKKKRLEAKK